MKKIIRILTIILALIIIAGEQEVLEFNFIMGKLISIIYLIIVAKRTKNWR